MGRPQYEEDRVELWQWAVLVIVIVAVLTALFAWIQSRRRSGGVRTTKRS